jgi:tetratricopeptide (TPR) repeat protein
MNEALRIAVLIGAVIAAAATWRTARAAVPAAARPLDPRDVADLQRMRTDRPHAAELFGKAQSLADAGDLGGAAGLFGRASSEDPRSSLAPRRQCEVLTVLGRRTEASDACRQAARRDDSSLALYAWVRALMAGPEAPSAEELAQAHGLAGDLRMRFPREPWGYAAMCDIGDRIGDDIMLQNSLLDLERVTPDDPETQACRDAVRAKRATGRIAAGWLVLVLAAVGTLAHALWRARRRLSAARTPAAVAGAVAGVLWLGAPAVARADSPPASPPPAASAAPAPAASGSAKASDGISQWPVDDKDPVSSVPTEAQRNRNPLEFGYWLQDCIAKGLAASKRGDHAASVKYFTALAAAAPTRPVAFQKLCDEYEAVGDREHAIAACGSVLYLEGSQVNDYLRYLNLIVSKPGNLTDRETKSLGAVIQHLREDPAGKDFADQWECEVGIRLGDVARLEECTAALATKAPNEPTTLFYEWALASQKGQFGEAERILAQAKATKMPPGTIARLERDTQAASERHHRNVWLGILAALLAAVAVTALAFVLRRREPSEPSAGPQPAPTGS